jgi:hypothetical protein
MSRIPSLSSNLGFQISKTSVEGWAVCPFWTPSSLSPTKISAGRIDATIEATSEILKYLK